MSFINFFAVGSGCFLGGCLRYLLSLWLGTPTLQPFPWATLAANLIGCFLLGCFNGGMLHHTASPVLKLFLTVGVCGGFTTFSTFTNELFSLGRTDHWGIAIIYALTSLVGGIAFLILGYKVAT